MHPLTPTTLPLEEFFTEFAALSAIGSSRNPLRINRARFPLREVLRICWPQAAMPGVETGRA